MKRKVVVVLGNGFDLDLGLKTSYTEFVKSKIFDDYLQMYGGDREERFGNINIFNYLQCRFDKNFKRWIDVEQELLNFSNEKKHSNDLSRNYPPNDESVKKYVYSRFMMLKECLSKYMERISYENVKQDSYALKLLKAIKNNQNAQILTFNYTNIDKLKPYIGKTKYKVLYIHGKCEDNSIILGYNNVKTLNDYDFMQKHRDKNYHVAEFAQIVNSADEIVIFGHSVGSIDHQYFQDIFTKRQNINNSKKKTRVTLFTWSQENRRSILKEVDTITNGKSDKLFINSRFRIYCLSFLSDEEKKQIEDLFFDLEAPNCINRFIRSLKR